MTLTWSASKQTQSFGARGRAIAFLIAASICALLVYLAFSQRFGAFVEWITESTSIEVVTPPIVTPPPPPPPVHEQHTSPPEQAAPINHDAPPAPYVEPISTNPPTPPAPVYLNATFLERPNGRDFERLFPNRALDRGVTGSVVLDCTVAASGRLSCAVASETPAGWGFGEASLRAAQQFRVAPATSDGQATSGGRLRVPMTWRAN